MNIIFQHIQTMSIKLIGTYCLLLLGISCAGDRENEPLIPGQATVSFSVNTGSMISEAGTGTDEIINTLYLISCEKVAGEYMYVEYAEATLTEEGTYTAKLYPTAEDTKLYLVANISSAGVTIPNQTLTEEDVKKQLVILFPGQESPGLNYIPMSGETELGNPLQAGTFISLGEISLVRSLAGVTVKNNVNPDDFILKSIQGYRANSYIQIIPDNITNNKVSEASVPDESTRSITGKRIEVAPEEEGFIDKLEDLYLPESEAVINKQEQLAEATCLIIGGYYKGATKETYYRIDFGKEEDNDRGRLLRNYKYNITITGVNGPGTTHPDDENDVDMDIIITMDDWEDSNHPIEL